MNLPKKSLGQNYLVDRNISRKIVESFSIKPDDRVVEIGPGRGAITSFILEKTTNLIAVEIDKTNCTYLKEKFPSLTILNRDILLTDLASLNTGKKLRVIGNIPYNITTPVVFKLINERKIIRDAQLMLQEEVARRLASPPGTKIYGIPSVILQAFSEVKLLFKVSASCFYPAPKVNSRVIYIDFTQSKEKYIKDPEIFIKIVRAAFATRRKTLKNSIGEFPGLKLSGKDMKKRPEMLSVDEFIELSNQLYI